MMLWLTRDIAEDWTLSDDVVSGLDWCYGEVSARHAHLEVLLRCARRCLAQRSSIEENLARLMDTRAVLYGMPLSAFLTYSLKQDGTLSDDVVSGSGLVHGGRSLRRMLIWKPCHVVLDFADHCRSLRSSAGEDLARLAHSRAVLPGMSLSAFLTCFCAAVAGALRTPGVSLQCGDVILCGTGTRTGVSSVLRDFALVDAAARCCCHVLNENGV
ncbi:hypothetical protein PYCCODRAFT_1257064 [Trametes coccinea BRFM310]|uniref:Uncharacterized protein n=1 Tax=Trametes coccinea (strain BRFM310) TaxID=1353009 RepID=A0A1Y2I6B0_TRAC3|nr:hypothetical protein PYCCODRAFT_1257064 [Trametes coccinea BRFM310]